MTADCFMLFATQAHEVTRTGTTRGVQVPSGPHGTRATQRRLRRRMVDEGAQLKVDLNTIWSAPLHN